MTYNKLNKIRIEAWKKFLQTFEGSGLDSDKLKKALDNKDCFNDVSDAILDAYSKDLK